MTLERRNLPLSQCPQGSAPLSERRLNGCRDRIGAIAVMVFIVFYAVCPGVAGEEERATTVGMPGRIEQLVVPGPELEVKPIQRETPVVVRIVDAYRHGSAFRYDIEYYGLEPGEYDLADYLQRKNGTQAEDLPAIPVTVETVLPPGQVEPNRLSSQPVPFLGGYQIALICGGVLWVAGLLAILFVGRKKGTVSAEEEGKPASLADRLQPIVEEAMSGRLNGSRLAELERMLLAFWRRRLGLEGVNAAEAITVLRNDEQAGRLLRELESWLHRPNGAQNVDVAALLEPYRNLPADVVSPP